MVDWDCGLFRLRISDFEDKGKHWDLPFEDVSRFQFAKDSKDLSECDLQRALTLLEKYREPLIVLAQSSARVETETLITEATKSVTSWLRRESTFDFFSVGLNLAEPQASFEICSDLNRYLESIELSEQERLTSETYVINPYSGEWIKGIQIVLAEMGVKSFSGTIPRTKDIFTGSGATSERRRYLIHRLAFVRAVFGLLGQSTVTVYRGMSSERGWNVNSNKFFSSWSFSKAIAEAFIDTAPNGVARHSYLLKRSFPIQKLFMTHVETQAMNSQYKEVEAVVLHDDEDRLLW
jgi:hypothetical protein